jgi:hypothetical protein
MVALDSDCNYSCHLTCKDLVNLDCSEKPEESDDTSASDAVTEAVDFTDSEVCTHSQHISHSANKVYYKFCVICVRGRMQLSTSWRAALCPTVFSTTRRPRWKSRTTNTSSHCWKSTTPFWPTLDLK